jgi:hypothetical protein
MRVALRHVRFMPKDLEPGVLYVSLEFGAAAHLCACGCGAKIRTPLGPTDWTLQETSSGPTLRPSIGNWQQPCRSHYWIRRGEVVWAEEWTPEEVVDGRRAEQERARAHYEAETQHRRPNGWLGRLWTRLRKRFKSPR